MLVLTAVSSIKTRWAGSSRPCSRIQRRRARATSAPLPFAARRLFFKGDVMDGSKNRHSALRLLRIRRLRNAASSSLKVESAVLNKPQYQGRVFFPAGRVLPPRDFRRRTAGITPVLPPS